MKYATYNGNVSNDIVGLILGPDLHGGLSEAVEADYDPLTQTTRVRFMPVSPTDQREAVYDEFGQLRLVSDGE